MKERGWKIKWNDSLNVGVPEIDDQHRQFVARVNELDTAILECQKKSTVKRLLDSIVTEAKHHFRREQQLLAKWKYPDRAAHAAKQAQLTAEFDLVLQAFEQADVSFTWALKGLYLKQLMLEHLLKEDMKYRDFVRAQQASSPEQDRCQRPKQGTPRRT